MGRTIRTCSALTLMLVTAAAEARPREPSALGHYVRARAAEGSERIAVAGYAAALAADPANRTIAYRAYREGVDAGDLALALRAALALEASGIAPPDAAILFYVAAVRSRDWAGAKARLPAIAGEPGFAFVAPILEAWLAVATRDGDPIAILDAGSRAAPSAYASEARALLLIATGNVRDGMTAARALHATDPERGATLRRIAEATRDRSGEDALRTPADGAAWVLSMMATDLMRDRASRAPLSLARFAQFARDDASRRIVVARALGRVGQSAAALDVLGSEAPRSVHADVVRLLRIALLEAAGRRDEALEQSAALSPDSDDATTAHGDMLMRLGKPAEAATAYAKVIAATDTPDWALLVAAGGAHERAGNWAAARPLLEAAFKTAPEEPDVLNHLGYALLIRDEETDRAIALIARASALRPGDAAIIDSLGWAMMKRGAYDRAIPLLERAVALDMLQPEIGEHLGDAYWHAGRRIEARYAWTAARAQADIASIARLDAKISGAAQP